MTYWNEVYQRTVASDRSWSQVDPEPSLSFIHASGLSHDAAIVDVGGGVSLISQCLRDAGWTDVTVLDVSEAALQEITVVRGQPQTLVQSILEWSPSRKYRLWHDRAVFHFLVNASDREAYRRTLLSALPIEGHLVLGTFSPEGPATCSGLPVERWSTEELVAFFGPSFVTRTEQQHEHHTPWGTTQAFSWVHLERVA